MYEVIWFGQTSSVFHVVRLVCVYVCVHTTVCECTHAHALESNVRMRIHVISIHIFNWLVMLDEMCK